MKGRHVLAATWHTAVISVTIIYLCRSSEAMEFPSMFDQLNPFQSPIQSTFFPAPVTQGFPNPPPRPTPGPTARPTPGPTARPTPGPTARPAPGPTARPAPGPTARPGGGSRGSGGSRGGRRRNVFGLGGSVVSNRFSSRLQILTGPFGSARLQCRRQSARRCRRNTRYRTIDGTCNNLVNPNWGSSVRIFNRFMDAEYGPNGAMRTTYTATDGMTKPLPNARAVSNTLLGVSASSDLSTKFSHMLPLWGQFLDHDITKTPTVTPVECCKGPGEEEPEECISIRIPSDDPQWQGTRICMELHRSEVKKRGQSCNGQANDDEQINTLTAYIDGSAIYGSTREEARKLRASTDGQLKMSNGNLLPFEIDTSKTCLIPENDSDQKCFLAGDSRVNVWNALVSIHTLFMRQHNRIAGSFASWLRKTGIRGSLIHTIAHEETRRIIAAQMQVITYEEFLPSLLGPTLMSQYRLGLDKPYQYDRSEDATLVNSFSAAALRIGHTLIAGQNQPKDKNYGNFGSAFGLVDMFNQPRSFRSVGQDATLRGVISEPCNRADGKFAFDMKHRLFEKSFGNGLGLDLLAVNTQRGRDHGLPSYKKFRQACGLAPVTSFDALSSQYHSVEKANLLRQAYGDVEAIDLFMGGVTETPVSGGLVGETFGCILGRQFQKLKYGDRFWFQHKGSLHSFSDRQIEKLRTVTLSSIICENTDVDTVPRHAMMLQSSSQFISCAGLKNKLDLDTWLNDINRS